MKKLEITCLLLFVIPYWGKQFFPDIFGDWYVQATAIAVLSILLPIGFSISLISHLKSETKSYKSLSGPITFLFIFCILLILPMPVHYINTNIIYALDFMSIGHDTNLLEQPAIAEDETKRKNSAGIIYYEYGKRVPYLMDNGEYQIFEPTENDISKFNKSKDVREETEFYRKQIKNTSEQVLYLQAFEVISFFLAVTFTLLLEQKKIVITRN